METLLSRHPAILEAAVIGLSDEKRGEAVHAVVVLKEGHKATAERIIAFDRDNIVHYKGPKSVDFIRELRKTGSDKFIKRTCGISTRGRRGKRSHDKNEGGSISRIHFSSGSHR